MKKISSKRIFIAIAIISSSLIFSCKKNSSSSYGSNGSGSPGTNQVYMQGSKFNPSTITVSKGTTITWTNKDNVTHTVTSNTGLFDSGDMTNGKIFSYTFKDAGTFAYYCKYHQSMGMTGTVVVQ